MKFSSCDKRHYILIKGRELKELKKFTGSMAESFGLDRRIENYQGKRPIGFYPWDLDCLEAVISWALTDEYPTKSGQGYAAMKNLNERIRQLLKEAYPESDEK
jgi:hypothetical protein